MLFKLLRFWLITVCLVGLTACGGEEPSAPPEEQAVTEPTATPVPPTNTPEPEPTATPEPEPTATPEEATEGERDTGISRAVSSEDEATVIAAFKKLQEVSSYRLDMRATSSGMTEEVAVEVIPPDKTHVFAQQMENITIGTISYTKMGDEWMAMELGEMIPSVTSITDQLMENITQVIAEGEDPLDGESMQRYLVTATVDDETGEFTMWVDTDGFIRQLDLEDEEEGIHLIQTFYDYNAEDIVISAPENSTDMGDFSDMMEDMANELEDMEEDAETE